MYSTAWFIKPQLCTSVNAHSDVHIQSPLTISTSVVISWLLSCCVSMCMCMCNQQPEENMPTCVTANDIHSPFYHVMNQPPNTVKQLLR